MAETLNQLQAALIGWTRSAIDNGWLRPSATSRIEASRTATPGGLFDTPERPLVAGLFGGTGVGKSSLLNRLAAEPIAQTSAVRPTSRDITVYAHRSTTVDHLPDDFPMQRMRTALHQRDRWRNVLWIDMPDFDSVEATHRDLVEQWLPHIDVLLYVVSPERYRDDQGWRLLLKHGNEHAWLFVMNHWDHGNMQQLDDFHQLLVAAGLPDAMIFRTDSSTAASNNTQQKDADATAPKKDDFAALETTIQNLAEAQLVSQLESRGVLQRIKRLRQTANELQSDLGPLDAVQALPSRWQQYWTPLATEIENSLAWKIPELASLHAARDPHFLFAWLNRVPGFTPVDAHSQPQPLPDSAAATALENTAGTASALQPDALLDEVSFARLEDTANHFMQQAANDHIVPLAVSRRQLQASQSLKTQLQGIVQDELHQSLALPGSRLQRAVWRLLGLLSTVLPLLALCWFGWRVINGFRSGGIEPSAYLGSNFAINGALLLALAWGLPAFLKRKLRPSREKAAARGLRTGLQNALDTFDQSVQQSLVQCAGEREALEQSYDALWQTGIEMNDAPLPEAVQRMLVSNYLPDQHFGQNSQAIEPLVSGSE
ncbi:MAG: GTPase domain-containing protein [Granulosicoccus sp.]